MGITVAVLAVGSSLALATNFPPRSHQLVNDYANMMTPEDRAALETELRAYNTKTSNQVAVITVSSLDGMDIDEYTNELFHQWGIGKKGDDNGVLLLFAPTEKKVRIEVGYGLEGDLNDAKAGDIRRKIIAPAFDSGDRSGSVVKGAEAVMADLGDAPYPSRATHSAAGINPLWFVLCVAGVALVLLALALIFHRRRKDDLEVPENEDTFEEDYPHLRRHYDRDSSLGVEALAGAVAASLSDDDQNQESSSRSSDSDDEPSSSPSVFSDPEPSSSDDSSPSSFVFGGGDSGGGGASGDL